MKKILIITITLLSTLSFAQTNYNQAMENALTLWTKSNNDGIKAFKTLNENFPNERLPKFYLAYATTIKSLEITNLLEKEELIEQTKIWVNELEKSYPNNSEIQNLKALNLTSELLLNPMLNGMILMDDINSTYSKALILNPNNPRTYLNKAEFGINASKFVGGDITTYCKDLKKAVVLFETEKVEKFEPNWGKDRAEVLLTTECKN